MVVDVTDDALGIPQNLCGLYHRDLGGGSLEHNSEVMSLLVSGAFPTFSSNLRDTESSGFLQAAYYRRRRFFMLPGLKLFKVLKLTNNDNNKPAF